MLIVLSLLLDLIRLPFRGAGWLLLQLARDNRNDLPKLNGVVEMLNKDRTVTDGRFRRKVKA